MKLNRCITAPSLLALIALASGQAIACQQGNGTNSIVVLPTLGGTQAQANALNAAGQITGFSFLAGDTEAHAFLYSGGVLTDLGTFGGSFSLGFAINASGHVAGQADTATETHAALYDGTSLVDLGTLGGSMSSAAANPGAINNAGTIVGDSNTAEGPSEAFVYANGTMTGLGDLGGGSSSGLAINQLGHVIGSSFTEFFDSHGFFYSNGSMTDLGTLGGFDSLPRAINDSDVVVGESSTAGGATHAFSWSSGSMTDLGTLGGSGSRALGINNAGQIIGDSSTAGGQTHGFLYSAGVMTDLGTLGGNYSAPEAINNLGQVVGDSAIVGGQPHAFLWQNGVMIDLNNTLPPDSGWELTGATLINDAGRIVGFGNLNGEFNYYILDLASANTPPVANAGPDQSVECETTVTLDGSQSSDADNDVLSYEWREGATVLGTTAVLTLSLPIGSHTFTLTVTDPCHESSQDTVVVQVADSTPPTVTCPGAMTVSVDANCQAAVPSLAFQASDNCTAAGSLVTDQNPAAGTLLGVGNYNIQVTVTDASGNSSSCMTPFHVIDTIAPVIVSGPALGTLSANNQCQAAVPNVVPNIVATDNCTAANALNITQAPAAGTLVGLGSQTIVVTVKDASGNSTSGTLSFTVADTTAPTITSAPETVTVTTVDNCQAAVPDVTLDVVASDNCTADGSLVKSQSPAAGTLVAVGQYNITVTVKDAAGNSATTIVVLKVKDLVAPTIQSVCASPNVLSPPNHQIVPVTVKVEASDNCDPSPVSEIISVTCNESCAPGDIQITGPLTVSLAASKNANGDVRVYTITVRTTDSSGNSATGTTAVLVKKNNGNSGNRP